MKICVQKLLSVLLIATTLQMAIPAKKAEAGLLFTAGVGVSDSTTGGQLLLCFGLTMVAPLAIGTILAIKGIGPRWITIPATVAVVFLDEKSPFNPHSLEATLQERYPFVDNHDVLKQLANSIRQKFQDTNPVNEMYFVSLTENETRSILAPVELTEEQVEIMVNELK